MKKEELQGICNKLNEEGEVYLFVGTIDNSVAAAISGEPKNLIEMIVELCKQDPTIKDIFKSISSQILLEKHNQN